MDGYRNKRASEPEAKGNLEHLGLLLRGRENFDCFCSIFLAFIANRANLRYDMARTMRPL